MWTVFFSHFPSSCPAVMENETANHSAGQCAAFRCSSSFINTAECLCVRPHHLFSFLLLHLSISCLSASTTMSRLWVGVFSRSHGNSTAGDLVTINTTWAPEKWTLDLNLQFPAIIEYVSALTRLINHPADTQAGR